MAFFANWGANLLVTFTFLSFIGFAGRAATFGTFALICLVGVLFVYKFVPETKERSLEEIEADLRGTTLGGTETGRTEEENISQSES